MSLKRPKENSTELHESSLFLWRKTPKPSNILQKHSPRPPKRRNRCYCLIKPGLNFWMLIPKCIQLNLCGVICRVAFTRTTKAKLVDCVLCFGSAVIKPNGAFKYYSAKVYNQAIGRFYFPLKLFQWVFQSNLSHERSQ